MHVSFKYFHGRRSFCCVHKPQFVHPPADGRGSCFQVEDGTSRNTENILAVTLGGSRHSFLLSVRTYRWTCWLRGYGRDRLRKLCQAGLPGGYTNSLLPRVSELEELKAFFEIFLLNGDLVPIVE